MSTSVEKLKAARELVARPGGWTQGAFSRRGSNTIYFGKDVEPSDDCFCAWGAIALASGDVLSSEARFFANTLNPDPASSVDEIADWNDDRERTQAEVVAAFDRAIALAEKEAC